MKHVNFVPENVQRGGFRALVVVKNEKNNNFYFLLNA